MSNLRGLLSTLLTVGVATASPLEKRLNNSVGVTPAMGFNNYNAGLSPSADTALSAADALVSLGLKAAGYIYINMDDGWSTMDRDGDGNLVPDPDKWPDGIEAVSSQLHDMGFKFG
jgi:alpha-galactosidase